MARIAGVDLPRDKQVEISLTYIYGIGRTTSRRILDAADVRPDTRVKDLAETEVARLREVIDRNYRCHGTCPDACYRFESELSVRCCLTGFDVKFVFQSFLHHLGATYVTGGADANPDYLLAARDETESVVECRYRKDLA